MRRQLTTLFVAISTAGLLATACGQGDDVPTPAPRRFDNLVLLVVDTLRRDHLPAYGYHRDTAPFLTQLAAEGWRLDGYSASSWTRSSMATLFTGLHPQRHQTASRRSRLPAKSPFLAEVLAAHGFYTSALVTNGNVSSDFGFQRGYAHYEEMLSNRPIGPKVVQRLVPTLPGIRSPFYLYVHFIDTHDPYVPETPWRDPGDVEAEPDYIQPKGFFHGEFALDGKHLQQLVDQYDAKIRELDAALRSLFEALDRQGLLEETLLVVTSDHGEEFGEHGSLAHGSTLFSEVLEVPLILWSRQPLPRRSRDAVLHHVDLMPTLLEALAVEVPDDLDGRSRWRSLLGDASLQEQELLFHIEVDGREAIAIQYGDLKLIRPAGSDLGTAYDLAASPREQQGARHDVHFEALRQRLMSQDRRLQRDALEPETADEIDDEVREQLEALGYLDGN